MPGALITPPLAASILPGITRDSIVKLAGDLNIAVKESVIPREMLYLADEVFFVGTAVEVTPIRSIDKIVIEGAQGLKPEKIKDIMLTREREFYILRGTVQRQKLDQDIERVVTLYNDNGYIQARVETVDTQVVRSAADARKLPAASGRRRS